MSIELMKSFLLWCLLANYGVLLIWFAVLVSARGWLFRMHTRWFKLAPETFDVVHYSAMAVYKIGILLFNLTPLLALCLIDSGV